MDGAAARFGTTFPAHCIFRLREQVGKVGQVLLIAIEQAVEAHRRIVMGGSIEGAEAKTGIESRLAHGAVAFIEIVAQPIARGPCARAHYAGADVATGLLEMGGLDGVGMFGAFDEQVIALSWMRKQPANYVGIVGAVVG